MNSKIKLPAIIIVGIFIFLFTACESYLKEENYTSVVADDLYASEDGYEGLVNTCYALLRDIYGNEPWIFCAGTDMYVEGRNSQPEGLSEYRSLNPTDYYVRDFYKRLYANIQICNTAISYNSNTEEVSTLSQRLAEVKFIRAIAYFKLVQHFGGVNICSEMVDEPIVAFERNTAEEVYQFIIDELEEVLPDLPMEVDKKDFGRVSKRAAYHFLAKVYLTRGYESFGTDSDFTSATEFAESAINGQGLNLTYSEVFWPGNEDNEEILFSVQYGPESIIYESNDGNMQHYYFGAYLGSASNGNTLGFPSRSSNLNATMYVFDLYTQYDSRWEGTFMNVIYERYFDYFDRPGDYNEMVITEYYPHIWDIDYLEIWYATNPSLKTNTTIYPYSQAWEASPSDLVGRETPTVKKFDDPTSIAAPRSNSRDIILARLGETYLIAAEAYFQTGNNLKAVEFLNKVRTRAAKPGHEADMQLLAGEMSMDVILDERALELHGEYHRWEDLKRTGTLVDRTKLYNRDIKDWFDNGINPFEGTNGDLKVLRPIPQEALDLNQNDNFIQNRGY